MEPENDTPFPPDPTDRLQSSDKPFFKELDGKLGDRKKLDTLLSVVIKLADDYNDKKLLSDQAWGLVELAHKELEREMNRQAIKSFRGQHSGALAILVKKMSCDYDPHFTDAVFNFLRSNPDGAGLIKESVRKDTLGKWLEEFIQRGGKKPAFIELKPNVFITIRR